MPHLFSPVTFCTHACTPPWNLQVQIDDLQKKNTGPSFGASYIVIFMVLGSLFENYKTYTLFFVVTL